jgi:hypothetical protein
MYRTLMTNSNNSCRISDQKAAGRAISRIILGLSLFLAVGTVWCAETAKISMTAAHWKTEGNAEFVQKDGLDSLELRPGNAASKVKTGSAILNDFVFSNGTIEFDVEPTGAMGAGIAFRQHDKDTYEDFYLRPRPNCAEAPDCLQYTPQTHGVLLWDLFPEYQAPAPLKESGWNHVKLVVSGRRMDVFINGTKSPTLKIASLEGDTLEGGLMLQGPGIFANLTVAPGAVAGLSPKPERDRTSADPRYIRHWEIAPFSTLGNDQEPILSDLPSPMAGWHALTAERGGLVNVSREYGLPLPRPQRAVVWLKTTVTSGKDQSKKVEIGWNREVWVFVNGTKVYADKNLYQPPSARKTPDGRCSLENGSFSLPLKAGKNEVVAAVANNFYGWGIIMRLEDTKDVSLARK